MAFQEHRLGQEEGYQMVEGVIDLVNQDMLALSVAVDV